MATSTFIAERCDFIGINYHFRMCVLADETVATLHYRQVPVEGAPVTAMGWEFHPHGLRDVLARVAKEYDAPAESLGPAKRSSCCSGKGQPGG